MACVSTLPRAAQCMISPHIARRRTTNRLIRSLASLGKASAPRQLLLHCSTTVLPWTYAHAPYLHPCRQLLLHCSNTVHPWTYAPKKRKAAALDGIDYKYKYFEWVKSGVIAMRNIQFVLSGFALPHFYMIVASHFVLPATVQIPDPSCNMRVRNFRD